jgi:hypothetical protein
MRFWIEKRVAYGRETWVVQQHVAEVVCRCDTSDWARKLADLLEKDAKEAA